MNEGAESSSAMKLASAGNELKLTEAWEQKKRQLALTFQFLSAEKKDN